VSCRDGSAALMTFPAFEVSSKRRKSYPSETQVKRGERIVHGNVELYEKLGRNDLCPCGSGRRFQALLLEERSLRRLAPKLLFLDPSNVEAPRRHLGSRIA
jgi:hypothetical protein